MKLKNDPWHRVIGINNSLAPILADWGLNTQEGVIGLNKALSAYSLDISNANIETIVEPATLYVPPVLTIRGSFGSIQLHAINEQLAEIECALRQHLEGIRYSETPDQQLILNAEINQAIEEAIA
ncbi:hypothetical protein J2T13_004919 [Paenibacillus sp. DS2015]|uniref:hypothetical protein n=1 Tax=Paenibacillus sp. DS2015 TaxID=3373917 RepID=UPI003D251549